MSIGDYIKRRVHWAVWAILLLLFCGAALGLVFKTGSDRGSIKEAKAWEKKIETLGYKTGEEVKKIETLHKAEVEKLTADQKKVQKELQEKIDAGEARIELQIVAETEWKRKYIQRGRSMASMRDSLNEAEMRLENPPAEGQHPCSVEYDGEEIHVMAPERECWEALASWFIDNVTRDDEPVVPREEQPCVPGYIDLRGRCRIQLVTFHKDRPPSAQVEITTFAKGDGFSEQDVSIAEVGGFEIARPVNEKSWSTWTDGVFFPQDKILGVGERIQWKRWAATVGASYALDPQDVHQDVGSISPEPFSHSADHFRVYFGVSRKN